MPCSFKEYEVVGSPQSGASPALMFKYHNDDMMRLTMTMTMAALTMTINPFLVVIVNLTLCMQGWL